MQNPPQYHMLFITHIEKEGPFLKIWGQHDKLTSKYISDMLNTYFLNYEKDVYKPRPEELHLGMLCIAKYRDNNYYRIRLTNLDFITNRYVSANFIDFGFVDLIPTNAIRSIDKFDPDFISLIPQAQSLLLADCVCPRNEWNDAALTQIAEDIKFKDLRYTVINQVANKYLARFFYGQIDLTETLITKGLMRPTSATTQEAVILSLSEKLNTNTMQQQQQTTPSIATYKTVTLEPGCQYPIYVSYITDGPCNFSIQLKQSEEALCKLMKDINSMTLTPLEDLPIPGTVCLARCIEDGHICRAVVTNEVDAHFKVFYVDFGNFEVVSLDDLYEIPFKYVIPKVMSLRYALAGIEKSSVTLDMQCAFKNFVDNRLIYMKVLPMTTRTALPKCELWDPITKITALDVLNEAAGNAYPEPMVLTRGFTQSVKISYVFSCNRLYVQLKSKELDLSNLMTEIQNINKEQIDYDKIKPGLPCLALYQGDDHWYRSQIIDILNDNKLKIKYVDYGNEEIVSLSLLRNIEGKHLTTLRPQAIECCLNGYQNMGPDETRDHLLEEIILEQEFTMKVVEMQANKALVELIDANHSNVASLLLERIAQTRAHQFSPQLTVQQQSSTTTDNNRKGHNEFNSNNKRNDYRNKRDSNDSSSPRSNSDWREHKDQGNKFRPRNQNENNDTNQNNWRQNKGNDFRKRNTSMDSDSVKSTGSSQHNYPNKNFKDRNNRNNDNFGGRSGGGGGGGGGDNYNKNSGKNFNKRRDNDRGGHGGAGAGGDNWASGGSDNEKSWDNNRQRESKGDWNNRGGNRDTRNDWNNRDKESRGGFKSDNRDRDFKKGGDNFRKPREQTYDGFKPKFNSSKGSSGFKREGSSSGSEKSFRKSNKTNTGGSNFKKYDNSNNFRNKFDSSPKVMDNIVTTIMEYKIPQVIELGEAAITISWFHNPSHFYCQLINSQEPFKQMMQNIQEAYKNRQPSNCSVGAPVIGYFPEDSVLYRGKVLERIGNNYKLHYVDFGNVSVTDRIWPIEDRFMELPAQAINCCLNNIEPPGETWPDVNIFADYFNKQQFNCKFISQCEERFLVDLYADNQSISELLLNAGLAIQALPPKPIDISILRGQTFRAQLRSINNLDDFILMLQNGTPLTCGLANIKNATEKFEDVLREKLLAILFVYVNDVFDNKLEVTLYNEDGNILKLMNPSETEFLCVDLICPYLILYTDISGNISHYDPEENICYIQPDDCCETLEYLINRSYEYYSELQIENEIIPDEDLLYVVQSSDTNWYRCRVKKVDEQSKSACVYFIDYGNTETIPFSNFRDLAAEFLEYQIQCFPVQIPDASDELIGRRFLITLEFTENLIQAKILEEYTETPATGECPVIQEEPPVISDTTTSIPAQQQQQQQQKQQHEGVSVILSHADSPNDFYIQLSDQSESIEQLQEMLQSQITEMEDLENPSIGVLCAAPYSLDQQWYRAQVLDADSDITTVRFVDYGNTDVLDNNTTKVKTLLPQLLSLDHYATRCRLRIKPIEEEWSTTANERFEQLTQVDLLTAEFIDQDEKTNYVELYTNGEKISDILINENLAKLDEILQQTQTENNKLNCFVSHLNSPSEFWIQLENCIDELEWIAEQLSGAENFPELEDLSPGKLCAALFPDDSMWYRARILSNTVAGIEVLFIDYGNSCTSCSLRELPEDLIMLPPQAQKCSLQKPDNAMLNWSQEMCNKFAEISADGQATFSVKKLGTGETTLVELLLNDENVSYMLLPITESVQIKDIKSFDDIIVVKDGVEMKCALEKLPDVEWNEECLKKFIEINENGSTVYQAEFIDNHMLRLYRNYNDIRLDFNGIKKSSPNGSPMKIRADLQERAASFESNTDEVIEEESGDIVVSTDVVEPIVDEMVKISMKSPEKSEINERTPDTTKSEDSLNVENNESIESKDESSNESEKSKDDSSKEKEESKEDSCNDSEINTTKSEETESKNDSINEKEESKEEINTIKPEETTNVEKDSIKDVESTGESPKKKTETEDVEISPSSPPRITEESPTQQEAASCDDSKSIDVIEPIMDGIMEKVMKSPEKNPSDSDVCDIKLESKVVDEKNVVVEDK